MCRCGVGSDDALANPSVDSDAIGGNLGLVMSNVCGESAGSTPDTIRDSAVSNRCPDLVTMCLTYADVCHSGRASLEADGVDVSSDESGSVEGLVCRR